MDYGQDSSREGDLAASIDHKLSLGALTGFVIQGLVPYGMSPATSRHDMLVKAALSGIPVAKAGRGASMGFADPHPFQIAATNLTATKARLLLMACLLKFGSLPPAKESRQADERRGSRRSAKPSRPIRTSSTRTEIIAVRLL